MVDLVPNHTAVDSPWTTDHPEYYVQRPVDGSVNPADFVEWAGHSFAHGADPYSGAWTDTVQVGL